MFEGICCLTDFLKFFLVTCLHGLLGRVTLTFCHFLYKSVLGQNIHFETGFLMMDLGDISGPILEYWYDLFLFYTDLLWSMLSPTRFNNIHNSIWVHKRFIPRFLNFFLLERQFYFDFCHVDWRYPFFVGLSEWDHVTLALIPDVIIDLSWLSHLLDADWESSPFLNFIDKPLDLTTIIPKLLSVGV